MAKKNNDPTKGAEEQGTTLEDFVIPQKLDAFSEAYEPVDESMATEIFDDARLRQFFKAYPCSLGDPLVIYLARLNDMGYFMHVSATGEPAIFVVERAQEFRVPETL